jgi:exodeoxyribonuclease VII large subunit
LTHARARLDRAPALALERKRAAVEHAHGKLAALSPRSTLARGYAIVRDADGIVSAPPGSGVRVDVEVADGSFGATVD